MTWISTGRWLGVLGLALGLALSACGKKEESGEKATEKGATEQAQPAAPAQQEAAPQPEAPSEEKAGKATKQMGEKPAAPESGEAPSDQPGAAPREDGE
jgi:type IV secretory pathway VirB10-like protein